MSGHSKFANIKHKKEKNDAAKGKIFTMIGREIAVAVKEGGPDPANNSKLAAVIAKAKAMLSIVIPLFVIAFQRADRLALAMEARGIESAGDIKTSKHVRVSFRDVLALFISLLLLSGGIFL